MNTIDTSVIIISTENLYEQLLINHQLNLFYRMRNREDCIVANTKEQRYERDDRRIRSQIRRYLNGERTNPMICTKGSMVDEYERTFGIILMPTSDVDKERDLHMYKILA